MIFAKSVVRGTQKAKIVSVSAPTGGWNARDSLADMDKKDAVILQNFWPGTTSVLLRNGFTEYATGISGQVETLMAYNSGTASKFFAGAVDSYYNVTAGGAIGAADITGLANTRHQYVNITTSGGSFLLAVNGADKLIGYDGTNWYIDGDASHDITGVDTADCSNITVFKNRVWFTEDHTLKAWYLGAAAISGGATALNMSSIFMLGGELIAAMTWTLDAGYGVDDYLAFITSEGEVAVWRLTDPTTPSGIALIGIWAMGAPVGRRCYVKYAGDLLIITQDGVVPMSGALQSSRLNPRVSITDKIQYAMSQAITSYGANFGWQLVSYAKGNQLYLNVPIAEGQSQQQYVQNNITKAWCNFTGWEANCWELFEDEPYFGGDGFVGRAWNGASDNGAAIPGFALQAFREYGGASQKQIESVRYHLRTNGSASIYGNVNVDYDTSDTSAQLNPSPVTAGLWDVGLWDTATWGSDLVTSAEWQGATGIGYTFAPLLKVATNGLRLEWSATDMIFLQGGAF